MYKKSSWKNIIFSGFSQIAPSMSNFAHSYYCLSLLLYSRRTKIAKIVNAAQVTFWLSVTNPKCNDLCFSIRQNSKPCHQDTPSLNRLQCLCLCLSSPYMSGLCVAWQEERAWGVTLIGWTSTSHPTWVPRGVTLIGWTLNTEQAHQIHTQDDILNSRST